MSALDPVQIAALDFARGKPGVGWFIEMGLGKSLIALTEYQNHAHADRMIIVCPNSFKQGWVDEINKHAFDFDVHVFQAAKRLDASRFVSRPHSKPPVFIVNYESLRMPNVLKALCVWAQRGQAYFVIDESIQIKGHKSAQTKAAHNLALVCAFVRLLTGRPQTQGPHDLWGQLRAIGLFRERNFYAFRGLFCVMGGWQAKEVIAAKNVELLASMMAPVVFQAKKRDWLPDLPRKDDTIRDYRMSGEQLAQYRQMEHQFLLEIENGTIVTVDVAIAKYAKLAQIQTGFIYDRQGVTHELVPTDRNPRLQLLLQLLREEIDGKTCVVYRHRAVFDVLMRVLAEWDPAWIKGEMRPAETAEQKDRFNGDPDCRVILLQCEAARYGHTLLGGPGEDDLCRTMAFFENSYSADTRDQIENRIHRRGQTGERVLYIDLSGSPLDRRITRALQRKDAMFKSVFSQLKTMEPV
jgi:hypothetical protein